MKNEHRQRAWDELDQAARLGEPEVAARALRRLFREQVAAQWWNSARATLARLEKVDPADDSGTPFLWQRGWSNYRDHDYAQVELDSASLKGKGFEMDASGNRWTIRQASEHIHI